MVMLYNNSPLTDLMLLGSHIGTRSLSTRWDDRSLHLSLGTSKSSDVVVGTNYSRWQFQRSRKKYVEI